jgi:hypothetical protein
VTTHLRDAFNMDTPLGAVVSPPLATFFGVTVATLAHVDPPGTTFYETTAQVAAALLLAFIIENGRASARHANARWAIALHVGVTLGILEALTASLWAIARDDGSVTLAGLTIGGLFWGVVFLMVTTTTLLWRSSPVAGALGEDEVVGGGEGG